MTIGDCSFLLLKYGRRHPYLFVTLPAFIAYDRERAKEGAADCIGILLWKIAPATLVVAGAIFHNTIYFFATTFTVRALTCSAFGRLRVRMPSA